MSNTTKNEYAHITGEGNTDFYCPASISPDKGSSGDELKSECVEKDVVERYAGDIIIRK